MLSLLLGGVSRPVDVFTIWHLFRDRNQINVKTMSRHTESNGQKKSPGEPGLSSSWSTSHFFGAAAVKDNFRVVAPFQLRIKPSLCGVGDMNDSVPIASTGGSADGRCNTHERASIEVRRVGCDTRVNSLLDKKTVKLTVQVKIVGHGGSLLSGGVSRPVDVFTLCRPLSDCKHINVKTMSRDPIDSLVYGYYSRRARCWMDFSGIVVGRGEVAVSDVVEWDKNPRDNDHAVPDVIESLESFGFVAPIVVRKGDNLLAGGHTRLKAAKILGLPTLPVVWVDCDDRKFAKLAIALNRTAEVATWREDMLGDILRELAVDGDPLDIPGWANEDLAAYLGDVGDSGLNDIIQGDGGDIPPPDEGGSEPVEKPAPKAVVSYQLTFEDEGQQQQFFTLSRKLKAMYPEQATVAARIVKGLVDLTESV